MAGRTSAILPWRYGLFLMLTLVAPVLVLSGWKWWQAVMIGFDLAAAVHVATLPPLFRIGSDDIRKRAARYDANRLLMLVITGVISTAILVAVGTELAQQKGGQAPQLVLVVITLALAWTFSNLVYATHYAHLYYDEAGSGDRRGIDFPGEQDPVYWDFVYFAFTLGMTFQTSDCQIELRAVRKVVIFHCIAAFVFNLGIVAFTINSLASG